MIVLTRTTLPKLATAMQCERFDEKYLPALRLLASPPHLEGSLSTDRQEATPYAEAAPLPQKWAVVEPQQH